MIEGESKQFEGKMHQANRYVEQIKTGLFLKVKKDVDLNIRSTQRVDPVANRFQMERELLQAQQTWINRIASLFTGSLGLLAGMSLCHLMFIAMFKDT